MDSGIDSCESPDIELPEAITVAPIHQTAAS
ncbi:Protein of unknown function [Pyronema omphalodes CBS 100304]|uniref:Uncharacterized protein n=1 Tax=Pyronema omphalodes (strain CBS 100304) TaxID=1076935 RepID=U4LEX8_PYROM|nr:Protein of unknown function [Pyronema omphalodes CBS 100304]